MKVHQAIELDARVPPEEGSHAHHQIPTESLSEHSPPLQPTTDLVLPTLRLPSVEPRG